NNIVFKDITTDLYNVYSEKEFYEYVRYEINRLRSNYGISSEILRYKILYEYGGIYFDSDIDHGDKNLTEIESYFCKKMDHVLFVDNLEGMIGNDAFISTINNPIMKFFLERAIDSYLKCNYPRYETFSKKKENEHFWLEDEETIQANLKCYDDKEYISDYTLETTGPKMIRSALADEIAKTKQLDDLVEGRFKKTLIFQPILKNLPITEGLRQTIKINISNGEYNNDK
ncbi:MAG: glycosyltransferase, partial [Gammaproteobacteria bacterium]